VTDPRRRTGQVVAFDERVGLGEIQAEGGAGGGAHRPSQPDRFGFHCTQLADGSRTVAVGTRVDFRLLAGRGGRWEAADIRPVVAEP
jgi:cold shock CspA family protein